MVGEEEKSRRLNNDEIYLNMKFDFTSRAGLGQAQEKICPLASAGEWLCL
jgi:hypothetical protein